MVRDEGFDCAIDWIFCAPAGPCAFRILLTRQWVATCASSCSPCRPGRGRAGSGASRSDPGHPDRFHDGGEPGAVVGVAARDDEAERTAPVVTGEMNLGGQTASRPAEGRVAEPLFGPRPRAGEHGRRWSRPTRATRCHRPRPLLPGRPAASGRTYPSAAHLRKRVCRVAQGPYRSGTSRQAVPVRNFHTIPFRTLRSSSRFRPRNDSGSSGRTNSHSASDSSWRRITPP